MATKREVQKNIRRLYGKVQKVMESEKAGAFMYSGNDKDFQNTVSHVFGDFSRVLGTMENVLESRK